MPDEQEILADANDPEFIPGSNEEDDSLDLRLNEIQGDLIDDSEPNELGEDVGDRLTSLESIVDQIPQPPFFPGLAIFESGSGNTYFEVVPVNGTLSAAGTGSFIFTGDGSSGASTITLSSKQFAAVLIPEPGFVRVVPISGAGNNVASLGWLTKVDGVDGDGVTSATWRYNVYSDAAKTILVASSASQYVARATAASNTPGTAGLYTVLSNASTATLIYAFESYLLDVCTPSMGVA